MKRSTQRATTRTLAIAAAISIGLAVGTSTSLAGVDSSSSILDRQQRTVEAIQSDTHITFVPPLDGNPLTREWFHDGKAEFRITGPHAEDWSGHITIGYQVGYPATLDGRIKFQWWTPSLGLELGTDSKVDVNSLIPQLGVELAVGFGPGIQSVEAAGGDISGTDGFIQMSGFHATVSGVLGQTTIRPWVKIVSSNGDSVTTYGTLWTN
ncbi:MspA family porin [Nocardia sp. NBC_01503]|uniref:MspA family porin n=1 Tax=Nocardia sp. NBC_01503 TaxID=2975997 RepID=UPI002E7BD1CD|nr:MspA family porin [Nocardia sp. NBC_01503]WTL31845.1 MspA family porin [Nocardia sp. NBC_01503]